MAACALVFIFGALSIARLLKSNAVPQLRPPSSLAVKAPSAVSWPTAEFAFKGSVFKKTSVPVPGLAAGGNISKKFRLAGTFFAVGANQQSRKAILDDLQKKQQLLVTEGELIDNDAVVQSILSDRVILRRGNVDEQIILCFAGRATSDRQAAPGGMADLKGKDVQNKFGKRVGDRRWVLKRSEILNYYSELLNNTERLAKVYESLKPVYEGQNIAGYHLDIEGEGEMFAAFGLQQGDIVRQVNSMSMTSQSRAEYFINEFVKNRVNGFVLDIERGGKKEKLIYMVR